MARINVIVGPNLLAHDAALSALASDLAKAVILLLRNRDVQVQCIPVQGGVYQFVEGDDGNVQKVEDSGTALEIICVEKKTSAKTLASLAKLCVALQWYHFHDKGLTNPNCWIRVYGTDLSGWFEGPIEAEVVELMYSLLNQSTGKKKKRARAIRKCLG